MFARIQLKLNVRSKEFEQQAPRLRETLESLSRAHHASGGARLRDPSKYEAMAYVEVTYRSGPLLREVVAYLDDRGLLSNPTGPQEEA